MNPEVIEFGADLLETNDLDPIYNLLAESEMDKSQLNRWLLAYSMFYHAGVASMLAEREDFYEACAEDFDNYPRCEERRHFRGEKAKNALGFLKAANAPEEHTYYWYYGKRGDQPSTDFKSVVKRIQTYPMYGPWIAFKLADMGERIFGIPIDFSNCALNMYSEPRSGAALALKDDENADMSERELDEVVVSIASELNNKGFKAPPWGDRLINLQEAETVLCKWKSFKHGHYFVGKDKQSVQEALNWKQQGMIREQLLETAMSL